MMKSPCHPGEILADALQELNLTPYALAKILEIPRTRIERLTARKTSVTPDTALRLAKHFGTTPHYWMNMQVNYDISRVTDITDLSGIPDSTAA